MFKKTVLALLLVIFQFSSFAQVVYADEILELKNQMQAMQEQMKEQQQLMMLMQEKIERLEAEKAMAKDHSSVQMIGQMQEKIDNLEFQTSVPTDGAKVLTSKSILEKIELGGEIELEFVKTMGDIGTSEADKHFHIDKVRLEPEIQINEDMRFEADIDFEESGVDLDEYYFIFENLPWNSVLQLGKDDRFFKAEKFTERYPLIGNVFWRDEELGLLWETEHESFYTAISVGQGLELKLRGVGEDDSLGDSYSIVHDDTRTAAYNGIKQFAGGLGVKKELNDGEVDVLVWGLVNKLSPEDVSFLQSSFTSYTSSDDDQYRYGVNLDFTKDNFNFVAQAIFAQDGVLDRDGFFVQPSYMYDLPFNWKYLKTQRALFRYGQYNVDNAKTFSLPATWDREEMTFALISDISENFKLKTEYTIDQETTGAGEVDNNEFVAQLEYEF